MPFRIPANRPLARVLGTITLVAAAAVAIAGCPRPNGYTTGSAIPGATFEGMVGMEAIAGEPEEAAVITQGGVVYRVPVSGGGATSVFLDVSSRLIADPASEEGLLGLAFAPDYASSGRFYVHYTAPEDPATGFARKSVIARFAAQDGVVDPASHRSILELPDLFGNHNGGALEFGPDGYLYIAMGDGGSAGDPLGNAQRLDTLFGKILRIDVSGEGYAIPPDNPFVNSAGARPEIYAYGLRNPWRMTFDRETGQLWAADVGQGSREEVNRIVAGGNYGWNRVEGDVCFQPRSNCDPGGTIFPRAVYPTHEGGRCAIVGGYVYRGAAMPELQGWYVYGDYCTGEVWAVDAGAEAGDPVPLASTGLNIASFAEDEAGELYLVTFNGQIARLVRKP
jgi:glucose/arabinose dehydrogenase